MHDLDQTGTITGWEPPARFAYEERWPGEDDVTLATEFPVAARAGGTCVVRLVSTFSAGGRDEDLDAMDDGWTLFLDNLRVYLTHFRGQSGWAPTRCISAATTRSPTSRCSAGTTAR